MIYRFGKNHSFFCCIILLCMMKATFAYGDDKKDGKAAETNAKIIKEENPSSSKKTEIEPFAEAAVIEIKAILYDELPFHVQARPVPKSAEGVIIDGKNVYFDKDILTAIKNGKQDDSLLSNVNKPEQIRFVLIKRMEYVGKGRNGSRVYIDLDCEFPEFPQYRSEEFYTLVVEDSFGTLEDIIPWPEGLIWTYKDEVLKIGNVTINPGEEKALEPIESKVNISIQRYAPVKKGDSAKASETEILTESIGEIPFRNEIKIKFYGVLPLLGGKK